MRNLNWFTVASLICLTVAFIVVVAWLFIPSVGVELLLFGVIVGVNGVTSAVLSHHFRE